MTVPASNLQSEQTARPRAGPSGRRRQVAGQSPTQLAMARFRQDKLSMISFVVVVDLHARARSPRRSW